MWPTEKCAWWENKKKGGKNANKFFFKHTRTHKHNSAKQNNKGDGRGEERHKKRQRELATTKYATK